MSTIPNSMRTEEGERVYQEAKKNGDLRPLQKETPVQEWEHWKVVENRFPYDLVFRRHHLLVPTRKFAHKNDMNRREASSLKTVLSLLEHEYEVFLENSMKQRSIRDLYHIHLADWRRRDDI